MCAIVHLTLLLCTSILISTSSVAASDPAWNGYIPPTVASDPAPFSPFYVPLGSTAYDSSSPALVTDGSWSTKLSKDYINGSALVTYSRGASLSFQFKGTGIEIYGEKCRQCTVVDIYIDRKYVQSSRFAANHDSQQQLLFFSYTLSSATHTIKLVNKGSKSGALLLVDALVVTDRGTTPSANPSLTYSGPSNDFLATADQVSHQWALIQRGSTGVSAMQLAVISPSHAIIIDKVEHNPLLTTAGRPAWGTLYNMDTHAVKPLNLRSNSFCAGGAFLSNGTLVNVGGNPIVEDKTSAADFGDVDGLQAIRLFHPCLSGSVETCDIYENHGRIRLASPRWYNTVVRIPDGSVMIIGGSVKGGWINNATTNNPTVEYYPPKDIGGSRGLPVRLQFLVDTLNSNLFPIAFVLPDGTVFLAANQDAMIYDWRSNTERRLPRIPNNVRVTYPMTGTGLLLPLSPENNYTPEVLLCGGSSISDTKPGYEISSQDPASAQCFRMVLSEAGIAAGWQTEEMPQARIMPDAVLLPTGQILIINGGASGISGYGNVLNQVGQSNAANPVFTPVLYDVAAAPGSRFSSAGLPTSQIPRLYHSVATLTPTGSVMIAGSNPNLDRSEAAYGTEYRVEWLSPPYVAAERPIISSGPDMIGFGQQVTLTIRVPSNTSPQSSIKVSCMDLGFVTHAVHANSRLVYLTASLDPSDSTKLTVMGPPNGGVYPPGPAWIFLVVDEVPSVGKHVMIGDGKGPDVDHDALQYMLEHSQVDQYEKEKGHDKDNGE